MDADNQQERLKIAGWIVGFIDGEGCFSITVQKSPNTRLGWQIFPEFVVTQGEKSWRALQNLKDFFNCGNIFVNKRYDNHKAYLYRYCVRSIKDIKEKVIPFFTKNQLQTAKRNDFEIFMLISVTLFKSGVPGTAQDLRITTIINVGIRKLPLYSSRVIEFLRHKGVFVVADPGGTFFA